LLNNETCETGWIDPDDPRYSTRIYPNPADKEIIIESHQNRAVHLEILSIDGKLVLEKTVNQTPGIISLNSLSEGIYIVNVHSEFGTKQVRLVKQ
jgi:hypothetical protein